MSANNFDVVSLIEEEEINVINEFTSTDKCHSGTQEFSNTIDNSFVTDEDVITIINEIASQNTSKDDINSTSKKRKNMFSTKNLYDLYCEHCRKAIKKVHGKNMTKCKICNNSLKYECVNCKRQYSVFMSLYVHLKRICYRQTYIQAKSTAPNNLELNNLFELHCVNCNKAMPTIYSTEIANCKDCENPLEYKCVKCQKTFKDFSTLHEHLKHECSEHSKMNSTDKNCKYSKSIDLILRGEEKSNKKRKKKMKENIETGRNMSKNEIICIDLTETEPSQSYNHSFTSLRKKNYKSMKKKKLIEIYCPKCNQILMNESVKHGKCMQCDSLLIYKCNRCKKQYSCKWGVCSHLRYECNKQRRFQCPLCNYQSKQKVNLRTHIIRQHNDKKCVGCGANFTTSVSLRTHQMYHCTGKITYKCSYCVFTCKYITNLQKHIRNEHNSKYECYKCGRRYRGFRPFQKHVLQVCGYEQIFECAHCSFVTKTKQRLVVHLKRAHV